VNPARRELGAAFLALALGSAAMLGCVTRTWVHLSAARTPPLAPVSVGVGGRSLTPLIGGLALVLLAGSLAVLATSGRLRQLLGALLAVLSALAIVWSLRDLGDVSAGRARGLIGDRTSGIGLAGDFAVRSTTHPVWPALCALAALVCLLASGIVALRGGRWSAMAARYDAPNGAAPAAAPDSKLDASDRRAVEDLALWNALDRGDDPTRG
jgi:uncharacterized membrane protein (TIGR02234 family)